MNLTAAIILAIKELRRNGQPVTQDHTLFIRAIDNHLTVASFKPSPSPRPVDAVAVKIPFETSSIVCGCIPAAFQKLFRMLTEMPQSWNQDRDQNGDFLSISGDNFSYRLGLKAHLFNIVKTFDCAIDTITVHSDIINTSNNHDTEKSMSAITITNNYFADLNSAIEAGLFTRNGKNPKKAELYDAIERHNAAIQPAEVAPVEQPANVYDGLLNQWKEKKAANAKKSEKKPPVVRANRGASGKSLDKSEVWAAERIRTVKRTSQMGKVLEFMFLNNGIQVQHAGELGLTKAQFTQAIGSVSEAGYGIAKTGNVFTVVLPQELSEPKLK